MRLEKVKKSVSRYLDYEAKERTALASTLNSLSVALDGAIIFGGMVREFALENARIFKSDIDIVTRSSREEIYRVIEHYSPRLNKFGGYRFLVGAQLFDIWSFSDTWAFKEGLVKGDTLDDLFKTTFFNIDAAGFDLSNRRLIFSDAYINALETRTLDINLLPNPSPSAMAKRALKLALENHLAISPKLRDYILQYANQSDQSKQIPFSLAIRECSFSQADKFWLWSQESLFPELNEAYEGQRAASVQLRCVERNRKLHENLLYKLRHHSHDVCESSFYFPKRLNKAA